MNAKPQGYSPVDWAFYNALIGNVPLNGLLQAARTVSRGQADAHMSNRFPPLAEMDKALARHLIPPACDELVLAVNRAVNELEGQGEKSDRIARQLLTALARFAAETGT